MSFIISLQFIALTCLFLGMYKHYNEVFNKPPKAKVSLTFKLFGWLLMLLSLVLVLKLGAISFIYWLVFLSLEILTIAVFNTLLNTKNSKRV